MNRSDNIEIIGWETRHKDHPCIREQIQYARTSSDFLLLFRGDKKIAYKESVFGIGVKALPLLYHGEPEKLQYTARDLAETPDTFKKLAKAYICTPMGKQGNAGIDTLMRFYGNMLRGERFILSQLLIYGLHFQNYVNEAKELKDYLMVVSATVDESVAKKYALYEAPDKAYILEFALPTNGVLYSAVKTVIDLAKKYGLHFEPNNDKEIFVMYGILPHYLLGYTELRKKEHNGRIAYDAIFVPNPHYHDGKCTLQSPPVLTGVQEELRKLTEGELAWVFHDGDEWFELRHMGAAKDISPPDDTGT